MHHHRQLSAGIHPAGEQQRLIGHQEPRRARLRGGDGRSQVRIDTLAVAGKLRQLLTHRLLLIQAGLARIEQCRTDQHVSQILDTLGEGKRRIAV
jgi:hypothetical protein